MKLLISLVPFIIFVFFIFYLFLVLGMAQRITHEDRIILLSCL